MKKIIYPILLLFISCNIDLSYLDTSDEGLTVEAYIDAEQTPRVYLTTSLPINGFNEIDFLKTIESTAKVEMFTDNISEIATFSKDNTRFPSRFYAFDEIKGKAGEQYVLKITIGDKVYTAETTVPKKPIIDKISVVEQSTLKEGLYNLKIDLVNPDEESYFKFYIKNSEDDYYQKASIFFTSNELINSPILTVYNDLFDFDEDEKKYSLLNNLTTYDLRIVAITKEEYEFWNEVLDSQTDIVNLPNLVQNVPSNISNGAFGYFSGNSEVFTSITINQ